MKGLQLGGWLLLVLTFHPIAFEGFTKMGGLAIDPQLVGSPYNKDPNKVPF